MVFRHPRWCVKSSKNEITMGVHELWESIPLQRGIKEGCLLSPALFDLVYEAFRQSLTKDFGIPSTSKKCNASRNQLVVCL